MGRYLKISKCLSVAAISCIGFANFAFAFNNDDILLTNNNPAQTLSCAPAEFNKRIIQVPGTNTILKLWDQKSDTGKLIPHYSISTDGGVNFITTRTADYNLKLRNFPFDPLLQGEPEVNLALTASPDNEIYIVQFVTQPLEKFRSDIAAAGGKIHKFLANYSYLVQLNEKAKHEIESLPYVRWVGVYQPAYRLDENILNTYFPYNQSSEQSEISSTNSDSTNAYIGNDNTLHNPNILSFNNDFRNNLNDLQPGEAIFNIQVFERGPAQKLIVAQRAAEIGAKVEHLIPDGFLLRVRVTADQLAQLLSMNEVLFADPWSPPEVDMDIAREIQGANYLETQTGFTGQGVRGEVFDTGVRATHGDFQNPGILIHNGNSTDTWHGSSTHGIVFGDGTGQAKGTGMLPDAEQDIHASFYNLTNRYTHTAQLVDPGDQYRAVFQTNSWGGGRTRSYTTESMEMDDILFLNDILICQSQSNAGNQDSRPEAWAKNIVSVGGVYHKDTATKDDDRWNYGGSIGPAADNRIKPDLTNFYDMIYTTSDSCNNCYTTNFGGTSGATPIVAGHFGLLFQMWHEGVFPGHGGGATVFDSRPHMSTAKAIMINTADQYPFPPDTDMTRFVQGWGMPDLTNMLDNAGNMFIVDEDATITNLGSALYDIDIPAGEQQLRVTMVYTDVAGTTSSSQHRINDLTLMVTSPSGTTYYGNYGLTDGHWSVPGGTADTKNTVENVYIQYPESGKWTVEIWGAEIVEDSHTETPDIDADFALVVSGGSTNEGIFMDVPAELFAGQKTTITVYNAVPLGKVYFIYSLHGGGSTYIAGLDVTLDLRNPKLGGSVTADSYGIAAFNTTPPANKHMYYVWIQAAEYQNKTNMEMRFID